MCWIQANDLDLDLGVQQVLGGTLRILRGPPLTPAVAVVAADCYL